MPTPAYCVVQYDGRKAPRHLQSGFRMKGRTFAHGEEVEVPAEFASQALKGAPSGCLKLIRGTPVEKVRQPATAKAAAKSLRENAKLFAHDPAAALSDVPKLSEAATKAIGHGGKAAADRIDDGKADGELGLVAIVATAMGYDLVAAAAARRAVALQAQAAG